MSRAIEEEPENFIERYNRLFSLAQTAFEKWANSERTNQFPQVVVSGEPIDLGFKSVVDLLPTETTVLDRDHLIAVYCAIIEAYLYRSGHWSAGQLFRIFSSNYQNMLEVEKQSVIQKGFSMVVHKVGSAEALEAVTPLKTVTNDQYSELYEELVEDWGNPVQKKVAAIMRGQLKFIHTFLPRHKIGDNFERERRDRIEPLPLYIRNEIHHPTIKGLPETPAFRRDKSIGYAIMEVWLSIEKDMN